MLALLDSPKGERTTPFEQKRGAARSSTASRRRHSRPDPRCSRRQQRDFGDCRKRSDGEAIPLLSRVKAHLAADRGAFICQSQSLNVHLQAPTNGQLTSMHFYGWKKGLKTGMYYLRTRPAAQAIKFTVDSTFLKEAAAKKAAGASKPNGITNGVEHSSTPSPATPSPSTPRSATPIKQEPVTPSLATPVSNSIPIAEPASPSPPMTTDGALASAAATLTLDESTAKAAESDPEFAAALQRARDKELEQAKLMCSIENKEACLMCSG